MEGHKLVILDTLDEYARDNRLGVQPREAYRWIN